MSVIGVEDGGTGALNTQQKPTVIKTCRHSWFGVSRMPWPFQKAQLQFGLIAQAPERGSGFKVVGGVRDPRQCSFGPDYPGIGNLHFIKSTIVFFILVGIVEHVLCLFSFSFLVRKCPALSVVLKGDHGRGVFHLWSG